MATADRNAEYEEYREDYETAQKYQTGANMAGFLSKFFLSEYEQNQKMKREELQMKRELFYKKLFVTFQNDENWKNFQREQGVREGNADSGYVDPATGRAITTTQAKNRDPKTMISRAEYNRKQGREDALYGEGTRKQISDLQAPERNKARSEEFTLGVIKNVMSMFPGVGGKRGSASAEGGGGVAKLSPFNTVTARANANEDWEKMDETDKALAIKASGGSIEKARKGYVDTSLIAQAKMHKGLAQKFSAGQGKIDIPAYMQFASAIDSYFNEADSITMNSFGEFMNDFGSENYSQEEELPTLMPEGRKQRIAGSNWNQPLSDKRIYTTDASDMPMAGDDWEEDESSADVGLF